MSERCPHLGHPDDPDEYAPICRECYDELRAACAAMEKALRECRDRLRHSLTDRESCDVCRVIDAALQDTEER